MKNILKNTLFTLLALAVFATAIPAFADYGHEDSSGRTPGLTASGSVNVNASGPSGGGWLRSIFGPHEDQNDQGDREQEDSAHPGTIAPNHMMIAGTVTAISGTNITISAMNPAGTTPTYIVDASHATILYRGATTSAGTTSGTAGGTTTGNISSIKVGDKVVVNGTWSDATATGTTKTIVATTVSVGLTLPGAIFHDVHPGTVGKVTAINGTTITITGMPDPRTKTTKTFTVDASNAVVMKSSGTSNLSAITVGSIVLVEGTVSGSTITATNIRVSDMSFEHGEFATIKSNGQPVIEGKITAISDTTVTVSSSNTADSSGSSSAATSVVYTVDASKAVIAKGGVSAATIANLSVGDTVIVQGTITGTAVVAATIIDHPAASGDSAGTNRGPGFFRAIGNFFSRFFGRHE